MAEIFLARKEGPEGFARELVVKRILPHLSEDAEFNAMFRDEARVVAQISHPNVVQVYDYGSAQGSAYLVMELVRGVDLRSLTIRARERAMAGRRPGAIPPHHAAKILSFVCEGLASAHERGGLVHRDVTPSNVLVSFDGAVKVADFGIAKLQSGTRSQETAVGKVRGKYAYLSPEQARGQPLDARSDLFNVGILLFETITGDTLFPHSDPVLARRSAAGGIIPDRDRLRQLPPPLQLVAERALAPRREDRFSNALAMRAELERYVRSCASPSDTVELGRFVRGLFPDVLQEDERRGPRAAGTVPLTTDTPPPIEAPAPPVVKTPALAAKPVRPRRRLAFALAFVGVIAAIATGFLLRPDAPTAPGIAPAAPPPPTPVATPEPSTLRIRSEPPGAAIYVDGEPRGEAPLQLTLSEGVHQVDARDGDRVLQSARVTLVSGQTHELDLQGAPRVGLLRVGSAPPGAEVRLDDRVLGETPLEVEVDPGAHTLSLVREGYAAHEEPVEVAEGSLASVSVTLRRERTAMRTRGSGTLAIATTPWCHVYLGRRRLGTTPLTNVSLPAGRHVLRLESPGRPARRHPVTIRAGEVTRVRVAL